MPGSAESQVAYFPYEDNTQTAREIEGYSRTLTRTPLKALVKRPLTLSELTGPTGLEGKLKIGNNDLSRAVPGGPPALGQRIQICGRVLDEEGAPVCGAVVECGRPMQPANTSMNTIKRTRLSIRILSVPEECSATRKADLSSYPSSREPIQYPNRIGGGGHRMSTSQFSGQAG